MRLAIAVLAAGFALTALAGPWNDESVSDLPTLQSYSHSFLAGELPYSDVRFEYPPLAAPVIAAAGLGGTDTDAFLIGLGLLTFAAALGGLLATGRLARLAGGDVTTAAVGFALTPLLIGAIARNHFELLAVAPAAWALVLVARGRTAAGMALLAAAAMVKPFALAAAPVAMAWIAAREGWRPALRPAAALLGGLALLGGAAVAISPDGAWYAVTYHAERPPQLESSPGIVLLAAGGRVVTSFGSAGLDAAGSDAAAWGFAVAGLALLAGLALTAARRRDGATFVLAATAALVVPAAFGKVGSPQFLVWAAPLLGVAASLRLWPVVASCALAMALTLAEFPALYFHLVNRDTGVVALTGIRDAALIAACAASLAACASRERSTRTTGRSWPQRRPSSPSSPG